MILGSFMASVAGYGEAGVAEEAMTCSLTLRAGTGTVKKGRKNRAITEGVCVWMGPRRGVRNPQEKLIPGRLLPAPAVAVPG